VPTESRTAKILLATLLTIAFLVRVARIRLGLPDFLEEAIPLRLALGMIDPASGRIDLDPHAFNYPSLTIDAHLVVQLVVFAVGRLAGLYHGFADYRLSFDLDPTPMVVAARSLGILADLLTIVAVTRIARRFGTPAAAVAGALVAFSPTLIVTSSSIVTDSIMTTFALWGLERLLAWHEAPRDRTWIEAAACLGLAASSKYPAGALLLPALVFVFVRDRARGPRLVAIGCGAALAAFALTSPYVFLDFPSFARDFAFESRHASAGHLGSVGHVSLAFHAANLLRNLGPLAIALALASWLAIRAKPGALLLLWAALLVLGLPIAAARIDAERYLDAIVAITAILAGAGLATLGRASFAKHRWLAPVAAALVVVPAAAATRPVALVSADTTQLEARRWCERSVAESAVILEEGYGPRLPSATLIAAVRGSALFAHASPAIRRRVESLPAFRIVAIPLAVAGNCTNVVASAGGARREVAVFDHAEDFNQVYYDPRIFAAADYVITSSAVRGRFAADPARFPVENALYRALDRATPPVARFLPHGLVSGPEILVYRIDDAARARLASQALDPLWWAATIPQSYRRAVENAAGELLVATVENGAAAPWVQSLAPVYAGRVRDFARELSSDLAAAGRWEPAGRLCLGTLAVLPDDSDACVLYSVCAGRQGQWVNARRALEATLNTVGPRAADPVLHLQYARALRHTGATDAAGAEAHAVLAAVGPQDPVGAQAVALLAQLKDHDAPGR